jgi:diaminopimelate epimerase
MQLFNADGSEASMCGNGLRCLGLFVRDEGPITAEAYAVETPAGLMEVQLVTDPLGQVVEIAAQIGQPRLLARDVPTTLVPGDQCALEASIEVADRPWTVTAMTMGASHCVVFLPTLDGLDVHGLGPAFECHPAFPQRTNVMFTQVLNPHHLRVIPWERGVGATLACGTGACAAVVAGALTGRSGREASVTLPGGVLRVRWDENSQQVTMTGPATRVFSGCTYY